MDSLSEAKKQPLESRIKLIANKYIVTSSVMHDASGRNWSAFEEAIRSNNILVLKVDGQN